ncbi:MAG: CHAP domain-containing protein [Ruminococcus sp.]|nr:CHAP domain-containing protein [Ruminococcus sp.]
MKKLIPIILSAVIICSTTAVSALADTRTLKLKVGGTTVKALNKTLLKGLNELREDMDVPKLKADRGLVSDAYKRASMLAVMYSEENSCEESEKLCDSFVIAKGEADDALDEIESSLFDEDEELNACGIANLTVGGTTFWVVCFDKKDTITPYSNYRKSKTTYSFTANYYLTSLSIKEQFGEFKNKTLRTGKKSYGRPTLSNGKKLANSDKNFPIIYTSSDPETATVNSFGKVTAKKPSYFKAKSRYTPKKGDFVLFHWYKNDGWLANHVGIVYRVKGGKITTIEGNTGTYSFKTSRVSAKKYSLYSSSIVGYIDTSAELGRTKAKSMANLAKKQLGNKGKKYYAGTKAWKDFLGGKYMADNWCAIFCGWLMENKGVDPLDLYWSPSCTTWINQCNENATAEITAQIAGTELEWSYNVTVTV